MGGLDPRRMDRGRPRARVHGARTSGGGAPSHLAAAPKSWRHRARGHGYGGGGVPSVVSRAVAGGNSDAATVVGPGRPAADALNGTRQRRPPDARAAGDGTPRPRHLPARGRRGVRAGNGEVRAGDACAGAFVSGPRVTTARRQAGGPITGCRARKGTPSPDTAIPVQSDASTPARGMPGATKPNHYHAPSLRGRSRGAGGAVQVCSASAAPPNPLRGAGAPSTSRSSR
ncbi:hypothetical protein SETIT_6G052400v2 [Setaria italica]|uniref:Uncharacterized protein n=1 Tax=Setaria italica TaxID=4555 RepID=A0A368RJZ4_SETIT|nr:hypothetical protein SETIT_6G052400v2 [Setaria italica]